MRGMIAWLVDQLQSEIKKEIGVTARIEITSYNTNNNYIDRDKADVFAHKMARHFDDSKIEHDNRNGTYWVNVLLPYEEHLEITAFYHPETEAGDSHAS